MLPLLALWVFQLDAQVVVPVTEGTPAGFQFDGVVSEWRGAGELRLAKSKEGLWVAGRTAPGPVRIWLAAAQPPLIPSFGRTNPPQLAYRRNLAKLFEREFVFGDSVEEVLATKAHEVMGNQSSLDFPRFRLMATPHIQRANDTFEALIPWGAFPPLSGPIVSGFRLRINGRILQARLAEPIKFRLSECSYPLKGKWFYPTADGLLHESLEFVEPGEPRRFITEEMAPIVGARSVYELRIADGEFLCGPQLAWTKAGKTAFSNLELSFEPEFRRMADGSLMVKSGPAEVDPVGSYLRRDREVALEIIHIQPNGTFKELLSFREPTPEGWEIKIEVSEDWQKVTINRHDPVKGEWKTETRSLQPPQ